MYHPPMSVKSRFTRKSVELVKDGREPLITVFLASLMTRSHFEFRFIQLATSNLLYRQHVGHYFQDYRSFVMAGTKDWKFVNVKLDKSDKEKVDLFGDQYDKSFLGVIDDISELGYKISVSYIDKQNSYCVSVSGSERSGYNKGYTLTSWASELEEAVKIAGYKVLDYMRNKDWVEFETDSESWG